LTDWKSPLRGKTMKNGDFALWTHQLWCQICVV
jgi:hypothetical protein